MPIYNKSHKNSALRSINKMNRENIKHRSSIDYVVPEKINICFNICDCLKLLKDIPDNSIQLILIDPPYNLELEVWDNFEDYISWADRWLKESYRVLSPNGNLVIFGGTQFQNKKSGDIVELLYHCRHNTKFNLVNTIIWYYKNGMSAHRYFANRHEEIIWLSKTKDYYFDLDSVRVKYNEKDLKSALRDKRLNPENVKKGKNPTNVWEIGRLNGNSLERVGHPTQKPLDLFRRLVKSLSYPGSTVLDFFAGSGTTGRVCIEENRNCILCDSDEKSNIYFKKHLENMNNSPFNCDYIMNNNLKSFFKNKDNE